MAVAGLCPVDSRGGCLHIIFDRRLRFKRFRDKKAAPLLGPRFQRGQGGGLSGKAMQVIVPPGGTELREMLNRELSEGHCCGFAASLLPV